MLTVNPVMRRYDACVQSCNEVMLGYISCRSNSGQDNWSQYPEMSQSDLPSWGGASGDAA
jgi:hypothetical protein